jgi:hypothetical protein
MDSLDRIKANAECGMNNRLAFIPQAAFLLHPVSPVHPCLKLVSKTRLMNFVKIPE